MSFDEALALRKVHIKIDDDTNALLSMSSTEATLSIGQPLAYLKAADDLPLEEGQGSDHNAHTPRTPVHKRTAEYSDSCIIVHLP